MEALWRGAINTFRNADVNRRNLNFTVFKARNNAIDLRARFAPHLDAGFEFLYDLNFDAAQARFSDWKARYPDDPVGPAAAASAYLFQEFDRLGVLQSELFSDDQAFQRRKKLTPDTHLKDRFDSELTLAEMLAAKQLANDAASVNALLAMTMVNGLRADYAALIERKDGASLSYTKKGRKSAERLLMVNSGCYDAYLALGVEN